MVKIKDLGNGNYQTYPITEDMIEVEDIDAWVIANTPSSIKNRRRIDELKQKLNETDYQAIKYSEGLFSEGEYAPIRIQRQAWRDEINELENLTPY